MALRRDADVFAGVDHGHTGRDQAETAAAVALDRTVEAAGDIDERSHVGLQQGQARFGEQDDLGEVL